jgi:hypothetical protein
VVAYFGEREVRVEEPSSIGVFGVGAAMTPLRMATGALTLKQEGALVELAGAVARVRGRSIYVDDGSGEALVYIDADTHIGVPHLNAGDALRVVGVVRRFADAAELVPRYPSDLSIQGEQGAAGNAKNTQESTNAAKESAKGNASGVTPTPITVTPTPTASPSATVSATRQSAARVIRRPAVGATTRASQQGLILGVDWDLPFAVGLLLLFSLSGAMALAAVWKYRQQR